MYIFSPGLLALPAIGLPGCHCAWILSVVGINVKKGTTHSENICANHENEQNKPVILRLEAIASDVAIGHLQKAGPSAELPLCTCKSTAGNCATDQDILTAGEQPAKLPITNSMPP